jgi:hypothetical protein
MDDLKLEAEICDCEIWLYNNGETAAANSHKSKQLCDSGLRVIRTAKPSKKD